MKISDSLREGSIYLKPNFLDENLFKELKNNLNGYEYFSTYQTRETYYGNRFQAHPCYETKDLSLIDKKFYNLFKEKIEIILDESVIFLKMLIRKTLLEEIKISKANSKYGFVHRDNDVEFAGVFQFTQSIDGGTAFFENFWDKYPDIEIGAYKNRITLYNANRWHSTCTDFTFSERHTLILFANTEKYKQKI